MNPDVAALHAGTLTVFFTEVKKKNLQVLLYTLPISEKPLRKKKMNEPQVEIICKTKRVVFKIQIKFCLLSLVDTPNPAMMDLNTMEHPMLRRVGGAVFRLDRLTTIWAVLDFG